MRAVKLFGIPQFPIFYQSIFPRSGKEKKADAYAEEIKQKCGYDNTFLGGNANEKRQAFRL